MSIVKLPKKGYCKTFVCNLRVGQIFQFRDTKTSPFWMYDGWSDTYKSNIAHRMYDGHRKEMSEYTTVVLKIIPCK